jgi:hypothetical protein
MPRLPSGFHYPAGARFPGKLTSGPELHPIRRLPMRVYTQPVTSVPLTGGQAQGTVSAAGAATLSVGPSGAGNVWYPSSVTILTTTGINDSSTCSVYLGPAGIPVTLLATIFPGGYGTASLAVPSMTPGQYLIAQWSGGHAGDTCSMNITGTMDSVMPGGQQ